MHKSTLTQPALYLMWFLKGDEFTVWKLHGEEPWRRRPKTDRSGRTLLLPYLTDGIMGMTDWVHSTITTPQSHLGVCLQGVTTSEPRCQIISLYMVYIQISLFHMSWLTELMGILQVWFTTTVCSPTKSSDGVTTLVMVLYLEWVC